MAYKVDMRDVKFQLFEWLPTAKLLEDGEFADWDVENLEMVLDEALKIAQEQMSAANVDGDRVGAQWNDGKVTMPDALQARLRHRRRGRLDRHAGEPRVRRHGPARGRRHRRHRVLLRLQHLAVADDDAHPWRRRS